MRKKLIKRFDNNRQINTDFQDDNPLEMEQITEQLNIVLEQLKQMTTKSAEHEAALAYLGQQIIEQPKVEVRENKIETDLFRIPDPIKSIPKYDGNKKQLSAWLQTAEDTLKVFAPLVTEAQFSLYLQCVSNKIEGKAKDILCLAGNPQTFPEIKEILTEALGDRQELSYYKAQLWATKQGDNMSVHAYFKTSKEIVQNIKTHARQNAIYNQSWPAISAFIEEDALAAFIAGLRKPYFGYAQAARPRDVEEAYAFLCKFNANELISNNSRKTVNPAQNTQYKSNSVPQKPQRPKEFSHINQNFNKPSYSVKETSTPMEVDSSFRSRNTRNKYINNHETSGDKDPEIEIENNENFQENQELESGNFQADHNSDTED